MQFDARCREIAAPPLVPLFKIVIDLEPKLDFGEGPLGRRVLFAAAGGRFEGARIQGSVLRCGGDWTLFRRTGVMTLDVRLGLKTDDGEHVLMTYGGRWVTPDSVRAELVDVATRHRVDPARYYFRTNPLFETGSPKYGWLNDVVAVGCGYLVAGGIAYEVFHVQ